ncbi:class F sortase [Actinomadura scrupuli]|uniref:class F sortase n=1 Tax=Actinomadura scrupuli TaxID=559629 RepID=UPI003D999101
MRIAHRTGHRPARLAAGVLLIAGLGVAGCGDGAGSAGPSRPVPGTARAPSTATPTAAATAPGARPQALSRSQPVRLVIPKIGVRAPVSTLGLKSDGSIEEPPLSQPGLTGWYRLGPTPGELGPAVIAGHVDAHGGPAVFARLGRLREGDRAEVTRKDGSVATFRIDTIERVPKNAFPSRKVYGDIGFPGLRLITCGGSFNRKTGHYVDNVIAYGSLISTRA